MYIITSQSLSQSGTEIERRCTPPPSWALALALASEWKELWDRLFRHANCGAHTGFSFGVCPNSWCMRLVGIRTWLGCSFTSTAAVRGSMGWKQSRSKTSSLLGAEKGVAMHTWGAGVIPLAAAFPLAGFAEPDWPLLFTVILTDYEGGKIVMQMQVQSIFSDIHLLVGLPRRPLNLWLSVSLILSECSTELKCLGYCWSGELEGVHLPVALKSTRYHMSVRTISNVNSN